VIFIVFYFCILIILMSVYMRSFSSGLWAKCCLIVNEVNLMSSDALVILILQLLQKTYVLVFGIQYVTLKWLGNCIANANKTSQIRFIPILYIYILVNKRNDTKIFLKYIYMLKPKELFIIMYVNVYVNCVYPNKNVDPPAPSKLPRSGGGYGSDWNDSPGRCRPLKCV